MSIFTAIQDIFLSIQAGNSLTAAQYETLAESSDKDAVLAVGSKNAQVVNGAYDDYVKDVIIPQVEALVLCSDGDGNEWFEKK
jgi:hypothetical protein